MKLTDDFEDKNDRSSLPILYTAVAVVGFIVMIFCIVLAANSKENKSSSNGMLASMQTQQKESPASGNGILSGRFRLACCNTFSLIW